MLLHKVAWQPKQTKLQYNKLITTGSIGPIGPLTMSLCQHYQILEPGHLYSRTFERISGCRHFSCAMNVL